MEEYQKIGNLQVSTTLATFLNEQALPGTEVSEQSFWSSFEAIVTALLPKNQQLLQKRTTIQQSISDWHQKNKTFNATAYKAFLEGIGYLEPVPSSVAVTTSQVDAEIARIAGPQLVVPVNNARYALNAVNARWGSLYDAVYGSNIVPEAGGKEKTGGYNPKRGEAVAAYAKNFLDEAVPLAKGTHHEVVSYAVKASELVATLESGAETPLKNKAHFAGYLGDKAAPTSVLFVQNDLHIEVQIDKNHAVGKVDKSGVKDIILESALTTIMDCEDSVAAVDAEDKVLVYTNWLGLMKGNLEATFKKGDKTIIRKPNPSKKFLNPSGNEFKLNGRSLMLVRNVGHLMTNPAILTENGEEVPEGIMDAMITSLIAKHDLLNKSTAKNSKEGSVYIVKPKMHGSEEVAFAGELFDKVEDALGLARNTLKIGVMDEERRTSLNLLACIEKVAQRIVFINTGFLDRTGDEMHTSLEAGPMIRKAEMKASTWLNAYEKSNVANGLKAGFSGKAQIGKGMWAMPDLMKEMIDQKGGQLQAGANTAWVPSPTAATLHAIHYHQHNVPAIQSSLGSDNTDYRDQILEIPLDKNQSWTPTEIQQELENNAQGILGYVVRWVEQGIGCSKVPDINNIDLMEDRATLRISSQHMANWLHHGIVTKDQIIQIMEKMAKIVDDQNAGDAAYRPMAPDFANSVAYQAALELVIAGEKQPNGYTEPILHRRRLEFKNKING